RRTQEPHLRPGEVAVRNRGRHRRRGPVLGAARCRGPAEVSDEYQERYLAHQQRKREVLISLINERHSTRTFSDEPVGEALDDLLRAGERAPSSCDRRGVAIHVVADRDSKALLGGVLVGGVGWVHRAPVVLLFMADPKAYKAGDEVAYMPYLDTGA